MTSLPLTSLESYLYYDDVPGQPCWQFCRFSWKGRLERGQLEKAWAEATRRQPLWSAVVRHGALGGLRWQLGGPAPTFHWSGGARGSWPTWLKLDLSTGPGARLYVVEAPDGADVILCVHHAVCDGLALLEVMEDTFSLYASALGDAAAPSAAPTPGSLRRRGWFGRTLWEAAGTAALQLVAIAAESALLRRDVSPLLPHAMAEDAAALPEGWPTVVERRLPVEATNAVKAAARAAKVSVAELCMRDFQAATGAWRASLGVGDPGDWIRLGTAVSLRRRTKGPHPAANLFAVTVIDRQQLSLAKRERLLRRAKEDLALVEKWRFGYAFWMILWLRKWWPGGIRGYARRRVVRMTLVMSYIGKVFAKTPLRKAGLHVGVRGAVLEEITGIAPTRPGTAACLDAAIIFGKLNAHLNFDSRVISRAQAEALMDEFARQLECSVAGK